MKERLGPKLNLKKRPVETKFLLIESSGQINFDQLAKINK
jgi:hypothetical protein